MIDLATVTLETFAPLVGQSFEVTGPGGSVTLRLAAAQSLGRHWPEARRDPFALRYHGAPALRLPQGIYRFEHPQTGVLEIFITQTGAGAKASEFEAVFT